MGKGPPNLIILQLSLYHIERERAYMTASRVFLPMKTLQGSLKISFKVVLKLDFPYKVPFKKALKGNK